MSKTNSNLNIKCIIYISIIMVTTALCSSTVYLYCTPKVYAQSPQSGMLNGIIYNCVIPKDALIDDNTILIAKPNSTIIGTRYIAILKYIEVLDSEGDYLAIECDFSEGSLIILAHDGQVRVNGNVVVIRS